MALKIASGNSSCRISVPDDAKVEIFDLRGNRICTNDVGARHSNKNIQSDEQSTENALPLQNGGHTFTWTPDESISSGIYIVKTSINEQTITKRIVYLK